MNREVIGENNSLISGYCCTDGAFIIKKAKEVSLDSGILYETVIDLSSEGLFTASCINMAAGILLEDLGLPNYFFENMTKSSLKSILNTIATNIKVKDNKIQLYGRVAHMQFDSEQTDNAVKIRIATDETRDTMEEILVPAVTGRRREYYFCPESRYYTYVVKPETVNEYSIDKFTKSPFLFNLSEDFKTTPATTRKRYEAFLRKYKKNVTPLVEVFNLPESGETRFMFNSDFAKPQIPVLRKLFEDHDLILRRAYWEPYLSEEQVPTSVCSMYTIGEITRKQENDIVRDITAFLAFAANNLCANLYTDGKLTFNEMLFAGNLVDFTHMFIYRENHTDSEIIKSLENIDQKEAFANRIHESNKTEYLFAVIREAISNNIDLVKFLFEIFDKKFNPKKRNAFSDSFLTEKKREYINIINVRFIDNNTAHEIFTFMFKFIASSLKTNFYKTEKRSFSFRFDSSILDPIVFTQTVYGIFFVNGHYACGTHLRAADIARGGLRLLRITPTNYGSEIDKAVLLNYALGPKAQRLKHKDICESGSKGVVVPHMIYSNLGMASLYDYADGILDLILPTDEVVDYLGKSEMIFFGPDEGTAPLMDAISYHAKERGYQYWRTLTTGKSFGIPHDTYGMLENGDVFGLLDAGQKGTELQINGKSVVTTKNMDEIYAKIGGKIEISGMTTTCVMGTFRQLIEHYGAKEKELNLMITGGPDGDLGSNEIQCYKGKISLVIDGGSVLFDPNGLNKEELMKIAFMRHTSPRANSLYYPVNKLSKDGFMVPRLSKNVKLPDGRIIEDGGLFHKTFLTNLENRQIIEKAQIKAFIPCGGFKDTINYNNVKDFVELFKEVKFIVEGANVFFDDSARRFIASKTNIKEIKDSSANKGGVFSSSIAEVLTGFLFGDSYEEKLLNDTATRWELIKDVMCRIDNLSRAETSMIINLHEKEKTPMFMLSVSSSEQLLDLQAKFNLRIDEILKHEDIVWKVLEAYIPAVIIKKLGKKDIIDILYSEQLKGYRNAIITKKLASMAFYKFAVNWDNFLATIDKNLDKALKEIVA